MFCAIIESRNRKRWQNINSFEFENVYNIIYQLVAPDVNKIFTTLLHAAWLYGGWICILLKKITMRKEEWLDLSFGILCGYKIKIDGKFIQRTTFSFSTDSLLRYSKSIYYYFRIHTNIKWIYFWAKSFLLNVYLRISNVIFIPHNFCLIYLENKNGSHSAAWRGNILRLFL